MTKKSFEGGSTYNQESRPPADREPTICEVFMFLPVADGAEAEPICLKVVGGVVDVSHVPEPYRSSWLECGERAPSGQTVYPENGERFLRCLLRPATNPQGPRFSKSHEQKKV